LIPPNPQPPHGTSRKALLVVAVLACVVCGVVAQGAAARTAKASKSDVAPCWKKVLQDWFHDGRIDGVYPRVCIAAAEAHIPPDAEVYSSFRDDARRAQLAELQYERTHHGQHPAYTYTDNGPGPGPQPDNSSNNPGPVPEALGKIGPSNPQSVPVPLIVLGGIAIALLVAAAGSYAARRFKGGGSGPSDLT
jgi:hypothetical protein